MDDLRIHLGFPLTIEGPKGFVSPGSGLRRGVIAALALNPNTFVSNEVLIEALWGANPPASARANLRKHLSEFRRELRQVGCEPRAKLVSLPAIRGTEGGGSSLTLPAECIDLRRAATLLSDCQAAIGISHQEVYRIATKGLEILGRGKFGTDLPQTSWFDAHRTSFKRLEQRLLKLRSISGLLTGDLFQATQDAHALSDSESNHEMVLASAQFFSGDVAASLSTISQIRMRFRELGLDPISEIDDLQLTILNGDRESARRVLLNHMTGSTRSVSLLRMDIGLATRSSKGLGPPAA